MLKLVLGVGLLGVVTSTIYTFMVVAGIWRFVAARGRKAKSLSGLDSLPGVTLLKPLHGAEPDLEAHLESFFRQDYPSFEILFCARHVHDAGLQAAQRVAARFPDVPVQFLTTGEPVYINAKVHSLERMEAAASHDILVISDSDVRVEPEYLRKVVAPFSDSRVGVVTCLYRGVATQGGLWARLEAAGMSIEMSSGVLVANMLEGMHFALGPTMAVRRECVREMGGFGVLGAYCSDDFLLGQLVAAKSHTVVLSDHVIDHIVLNLSFWSSIKHQIRWMKSTRFSRPKGHLGTALTFSVPFGLVSGLAAASLGMAWMAAAVLGWSILSRVGMAAMVGALVVDEPRPLLVATLYPLRDLMGFGYWAASYTSNRIVWRNEIYELTAGGRMLSTGEKPAGKREPALTA